MILIADSGGSKIDWRLVFDNGSIQQANAPGFNPYYHAVEELQRGIEDCVLPLIREEVRKIFFYGAGVSSDKNQRTVRQALESYFNGAAIEIGWDLLAAARALCGSDPGIACILGTGSNSCLYDGEKIVGNVVNLGWILADEGSGACLGKQLIVDYLRENMPSYLIQLFKEKYKVDKDQVLENVYQREKANSFLGSFTHFLNDHIREPYCYQLVYDSFSDFYENNVMRYENYQQLPVHYTGSIAYHFNEILRQVGKDKGVTVKNILEGPISGLTIYHQKDI